MERSFAAYLPQDRYQALARGSVLPEYAAGAALFADISGFTPLTETLTRELGPQRGAEELSRQLIVIYSALIAQVDQYRGSVISFSGDAITCWFDDAGLRTEDRGLSTKLATQSSELSPQHSASLRALACALAMQEALSYFATVETPSGDSVALAIKVAVAAGPVRRFLIGDPQIQLIDVLAGATLSRLAAAEHQAEKGEVVASAEVVGPGRRQHLRGRRRRAPPGPRRDGHPPPRPAPGCRAPAPPGPGAEGLRGPARRSAAPRRRAPDGTTAADAWHGRRMSERSELHVPAQPFTDTPGTRTAWTR
jgi:class 3 adenylate cyclase